MRALAIADERPCLRHSLTVRSRFELLHTSTERVREPSINTQPLGGCERKTIIQIVHVFC